MKRRLSELSEIRKGVKLDARSLVDAKHAKGVYYAYLDAQTSVNNSTKFVTEEELKKLNFFSNRLFLNYGDYLIYKEKGKFRIKRYEQLSGQTIPSDTFIVITFNHNIIGDFLSFEKNEQHFSESMEQLLLNNKMSEIEAICNVEIKISNLQEMQDPNFELFDRNDLPIRFTQRIVTLDHLIKRVAYGELVLDTEFQRKSSRWTLEIKSRFVESLIVQLPVPAFYFDIADDERWLIIDGLQRLNTILEYMNGHFGLVGLEYLGDLNGKKFADLERNYQRNIEEYQFFACLLQKGTPQNVKHKIYKNINLNRFTQSF
jgi:Protein of unknown function DUF262